MNIMTKRGSLDNIVTFEHICDTLADREHIDPHYVTLGSTCIVLQGESGGLEVYMASSDKEWFLVSDSSGGGGGGSGTVSFYICTTGEYDPETKMPTIEAPEYGTFYLVPGGDSPDLFTEWVYVDEAWEQFGGATIDLTPYALKSELPTKVSDLVNDSNFAVDEHYVHTDNNYTTAEKNKLSGIAAGAEVNVNADWNATSGDAQILNKPTNVSSFINDSGYLTAESDPTVSAWAKAANKPSYTASEVGALPSNTHIPSTTAELTNDAGFITSAALETKAEIDGAYEDMTVGNAEQLVSTVYTEDQVPYKFRTSGGSADIGNRETDMIVGGTVAWNQIVRPNGTADNTANGIRIKSNADGSIELDGTATANFWLSGYFRIILPNSSGHIGHTVLIIFNGNATIPTNRQIGTSSQGYVSRNNCAITNNFRGDSGSAVQMYMGEGDTYTNAKFYPQFFDLTAMFGSTIADYLYNLEQTTPGAGVAWFKRYFPNDYYEYNPGELMSVEGLESHDMVGFNAYNPTTDTAAVLGGNQYQITGAYTALSLDGETITPVNGLFTPDHNGSLTVTGGGADTCVHLVWSGYRNGEYEPYEKHSYPLDDALTLRGIPQLDASGNLYYDGDTYESDGTVTRRYGVVDLGTLDWTYNSGNGFFYTPYDIEKTTTRHGHKYICSHSKFIYESVIGLPWAEPFDGLWVAPAAVSQTSRIYAHDSAYTDAATFKAAMNGVMLVYALATPTTETADPYQNPQVVDDFGTEEYVTDSIVPVGHVTQYMANLRDKLQHLPELAGADGDYIVRQSGSQMTLVPNTDVPVQDVQINGTSVLDAQGVANVPMASSSTLGAVLMANSAQIKAGANTSNPFAVGYQHMSTFYGLAKAAGDTTQSASSNAVGTYTDAAKTAIQTMLSVQAQPNIEVVSGTAATIVGVDNTLYRCGEVYTISITAPASGSIDVVFTSGSTVAVLTSSGITWPEWFDPTDLDTNTIYEINVADGRAVIATWPAA